jgi:hypothetical protein
VFPKMETEPRLSSEDGWIWGKSDSSRWDFSGSGKHTDLVYDEMEPGLWRVLMSRHVENFGINTEKDYRRFADPNDLLSEQGVVEADGTVRYEESHPALVYRYVARNDDTRTLITSALPASGFLYSTGYIHGIEHKDEATATEHLALLGYLNSLTADWWTRRLVDRHMTAPVLNNLPLPDWGPEEIQNVAELAAELSRRGGVESLPGGAAIDLGESYSDSNRDEIRARIESFVAKGYDLEREELDTVLSDFSTKAASQELRERIQELAAGDSVEAVTADQKDD